MSLNIKYNNKENRLKDNVIKSGKMFGIIWNGICGSCYYNILLCVGIELFVLLWFYIVMIL